MGLAKAQEEAEWAPVAERVCVCACGRVCARLCVGGRWLLLLLLLC